MRTEPGMTDAVLDLDGVLTTRDTFAALLTAAALRAPVAGARSAPELVRWLRAGHDVPRHAAASRDVARSLLRGMTEPQYEALAAAVGARLGAVAARRSMLEVAAGLRRAGAHVVVATGSEHRLAAAFLAAAGVEHDLLLASTLRWTPTGPEFDRHIRGEGKLSALREAGVDIERRRFWTDSFDDFPTAAAAASVVLVAPSRHSAARYRASGLDVELLGG
ncbi:haloacid dehalogenase-like hydrolase [Agrococcus sp. HG114]|uniref:haloacid dehalogenase-like hydrolase n=1 Tax=Agrococcus sp. HG114 TaxID=2969757 RepID=UPI00215AA090|nr:haloacid dehalogenase-like hydrolase [Agrococcus sp. HG114]MCR8670103.1 haloacid dehalogenase-like hydrolase [Agrococcus sp. HG114]